MEEYLDEICLFLLCAVLLPMQLAGEYAVVGLLAALIMVCLQAAGWRALRFGAQLLFLAMACVSSAALAFLPVLAYVMMHERRWVWRLLWIVALAHAALALSMPAGAMVQGRLHAWSNLATAGLDASGLLALAVLCAVAVVLAVRDVRAASERAGLRHAYDVLRERNFQMQAADDTPTTPSTITRPAQPQLFENLTQREISVAELVARGMDNREIAAELFLSEGTVRNNISSILAKKGLQNRTQIAVMYYRS